MKKIYLLSLATLITLFSCQDDTDFNKPDEELPNTTLTNHEMPKAEVERLLSEFISKVQPTVKTRTGGNGIKIKNSQKKYSEGVTTRSGQSEKVALYEFNLEVENKDKYAMVCADSRLPMVVAYINGNMPMEGIP